MCLLMLLGYVVNLYVCLYSVLFVFIYLVGCLVGWCLRLVYLCLAAGFVSSEVLGLLVVLLLYPAVCFYSLCLLVVFIAWFAGMALIVVCCFNWCLRFVLLFVFVGFDVVFVVFGLVFAGLVLSLCSWEFGLVGCLEMFCCLFY